jgi:hypothetical protein
MKYVGWMVALALGALAAWAAYEARGLRTGLAAAHAELAAAEARLEEAIDELESLRDNRDRLAGENRAMQTASRDTAPATAAAPVTPPAEESRETEEAGESEAMRRRVAAAQLGALSDIAYRAFYDEIGLSAETRNALRPLVVEAMERGRVAMERALRDGDVPAREIRRIEDEAEAWLAEAVGEILTPEQRAGWDAYQDYADQVLYEYLLDGQLTMLAQGLAPENRRVVKEVFAEELKVSIDTFMESDALFSLDSYNDAQMVGLRRGLERMGSDLDPGQYQEAVGFVDQAAAMFDAMAQ